MSLIGERRAETEGTKKKPFFRKMVCFNANE